MLDGPQGPGDARVVKHDIELCVEAVLYSPEALREPFTLPEGLVEGFV